MAVDENFFAVGEGIANESHRGGEVLTDVVFGNVVRVDDHVFHTRMAAASAFVLLSIREQFQDAGYP